MSLSVRDDETGLEYAGALGLRGLFPGGANLSNPAYLRLVAEIPRFHRRARALLADPPDDFGRVDTTLRDFLRAGRFSAYFERHFMEPLVAAVWSCDPDVALDYPARYLFEFLHHHRMLRVFGSPTWRTVVGGSREYVARVAAGLDDVRVGTKVTSVRDTGSGGRGHRRQRRGHHGGRRRDRHPPRPRARDAGRADGRSSARCWARSPTPTTPPCCTPTQSLLPRAGGRPGVVELPAAPAGPAAAGGRHRDLRPDPPPAARHRHPLPGHARRRGPGRPGVGDRPDGVRPPALRPRVRRGPAPPARHRHRPDRVRRGLPRLGVPRGRRPVRRRRGRAARASRWHDRPALTTAGVSAGLRRRGSAVRYLNRRRRRPTASTDDDPAHPAYAVPPHVRAPLPHLAGGPRPPPRPRACSAGSRPRDHLGSPERTLRENVERFLAAHGVQAPEAGGS